MKLLSHVRLFLTSWTVACQASLSLEFSQQGYWSGLPFPSPRDLPDPRIERRSPALRAESLPSEPLAEALAIAKLGDTFNNFYYYYYFNNF